MSRRSRLPWVAAALAALAGGALLVLAVWVEPGGERKPVERKPRIADATDLAAPGALRADEATGATKDLASQGVALERGAWVQVADESGRLAQQYSASRIDPERDRWMRMSEPRAMMFPKGGRVITMRAEKGRMRVPERAIESGRLDGTVVIRMYKPEGSRAVDTAKDAPALVVEADEALFDSRLGEIRCDRRVKVVTDQLHFEGEGLTMLLTPDGKNIERLTVERPLSPIEIVRRVTPEPAAPVEFFGPPAPAGPSGLAPVVAPPLAAAAPPVRFYKLTLEREVRVTRQGPKDRTRIDGDRLDAIFSLEGDAVGSNLALAPASGGAEGAPAAGLPMALLAGAMAAPGEVLERIEIRYAGRLTMAVTEDAGDRLVSKDDVRVDIGGSPVRMADDTSGARVDCGSLRYTTGDESVAIASEKGRRFVLASPRLDLEATRFELNRRTGKGAIDGEGRMRLGGADGAAVQVVASMPAEAVKAGGGVSQPEGAAVPPSSRTVRMQWSKGVSLAFEPGAQASRLRSADFRGAVIADAQEVRLGAERLLVECVAQGSRDSVTHLLAEGAARAERQPEGSSLAGERIDLALEPQADGGSRPLRLLADGKVEAADKGQRLWTDAMECTFRPPADAGAASDRVDIAEVKSRGAVQALVSQDARIWAADMDADPAGKRVTLKGPDLLLVRGNAVADGMQRIDMDETSGVGSAPGAGRCRYFSRSLVDGSPKPLPRPTIPAGEQMLATWGDGLKYRRVDARTSEVELGGGVKAVASRSARERDELDAKTATLTLTSERTAGAPARAGVAGEASSLTRVHAAGEVRIESRGWSREDHSDEPRLFRLQAEDVTHDLATGEAEVPTAGTLLVFDRDDEGAKAAPPSLFDGRGTTRFKWANRLDMRRAGLDGRYRIDLEGTVEMLHAGLRPQDTLTLTADRLQATVDRVEEGAQARQPGDAAAADLGGPVRLVRVEGLGRVFVRTPDVDVECDTFDYDLKTRIAQMAARPGRMITVLQKGPKGQPVPMRAESAQWDMESGRIRIVGASGSGMR